MEQTTNQNKQVPNERIGYIEPSKAIENTDYLKTVFDNISKRFPEEFEHAQGRSNFQIEKFVALNDFTPSAVYKHCLKNASIMRKELFRVIREGIERQREFDLRWGNKTAEEKTKPVEVKTREGGVKLTWHDLDLYDYQMSLQELAVSVKDKVQQLAMFDEILDSLITKNDGKPFTKEQFDKEEPTYWGRRFAKQIHDDLISRSTGVGGGNLESVRNATAPTIIPDSINKITNIPSFDTLMNNPIQFIKEAQVLMMEGYSSVSSEQLLENHPTETVNVVEDLSEFRDPADLGIGKTSI